MANSGDVAEKVKSLASALEGSQSPAERKETASSLMALLDTESESYGGDAAVEAALNAGLSSILRYRLDSMDGDWMAEAKNGAMDLMDELARLPKLQATFDLVTDMKNAKVNAAIEEQHGASHGPDGHDHGHEDQHGHARRPGTRRVGGRGRSHQSNAQAQAAAAGAEGISLADLHQQLKEVRN